MNPPTEYRRIAVIVPKAMKKAMINYSNKTGRNLTWTINTLITKLLNNEINLDNIGQPQKKERTITRGRK